VSALTRTHVAAALAGDAGDELFGGYPKYFAQRWAAVLAHVPAPLRRWCIEMPLRLLPSPDGSVLLGQNKIAAFFRSIDQDYAVRSHLWVAAFLPDQIAELIGSPFTQDALEPVLRRAAEYQGPDDIVTKSMFLDFKLLLLDGSNVKTDRASSLAGLELREPFMDTEVIELAARIPSQFKVKRLCTKYLTRLLATRYYPREFVYRKKWGFGIPVKRWIRGELRPRFQDVLSTDNVRKAGLVNPAFCTKLLDDHLAERSSCAGQLWNLFVLHLWHANWSA
jgi:asparagine synthase (glutamine-hydrolysing)